MFDYWNITFKNGGKGYVWNGTASQGKERIYFSEQYGVRIVLLSIISRKQTQGECRDTQGTLKMQ